jgi:hypothetical protein
MARANPDHIADIGSIVGWATSFKSGVRIKDHFVDITTMIDGVARRQTG